MTKREALFRYKLEKLDNETVFIQGDTFNFCFTKADAIVKDEYKGLYSYFGGLQCPYKKDSVEYRTLERWLCELAEKSLKIL